MVLHPHRVSGVWSKKEALDHINSLELKAVLLMLQNLESHVLGRSVLIFSDYMTVVSFINYQGGTLSSSLCRLALDLWEWCLQRNIFPPGSSHSERREYCGGFSLQGKVSPFRMGPESFSVSEVLLCVVSLSRDRLARFGAQLPALEVLLSVPSCSGLEDSRVVVFLSRIFACTRFLPRILDKVAQDLADLLLVASYWLQRPWFPRLLRLLVGLPRVLSVLKDLVVLPLSLTPHPRVESLHLSLWPLSGSRVRMQAFLKELRSYLRKHSDSPLATLMSLVWTLSGSGVPRSLGIPLLPL